MLVIKKVTIGRVLFEARNWSYTKASYLLAGIGANERNIQDKVYKMFLKDKNSRVNKITHYGIPNILNE